jgi:hypothetical protein
MYNPESIIISTAGHTLGNIQMLSKTEINKLKLIETRGCPVNRKTPTVMTKNSFINLCLKYQRRANNSVGDVSIRGGHFSYNNRGICAACAIGKKIENNEEFTPPVGITFKNLKDFK